MIGFYKLTTQTISYFVSLHNSTSGSTSYTVTGYRYSVVQAEWATKGRHNVVNIGFITNKIKSLQNKIETM